MNVDDRGMLGLARQVVGNIEEGGDGRIAILTGVMNKVRFDHVLGAHSAYERMRELMRLGVGRFSVSQVIDPQIARSGRAGVVVEEARIVASEWRWPARGKVHAFRQGQSVSFSGCYVVQVDFAVAIDFRVVSDKLAVRRKALSANFPLVRRDPVDFLPRDVEQADVVV